MSSGVTLWEPLSNTLTDYKDIDIILSIIKIYHIIIARFIVIAIKLLYCNMKERRMQF